LSHAAPLIDTFMLEAMLWIRIRMDPH
jgi:hypothetical protein